MGAASAGGPFASGGRLDEALVGVALAQFVEDAPVGGDDEEVVGQFPRRLDDLAGGPHGVGDADDRGRGLRVDQNAGIRVNALEIV